MTHRQPPPRNELSVATTGGRGVLEDVPVLVVEDDVSNRKLVSLLLTQAGARVRSAGSAEEALTVLATFQPIALILDLTLPSMSGLLFLETIKAEPAMRDIVVIAVTSMNGAAVAKLLLAAGCATYVRKPIDVRTFTQIVASALTPAASTQPQLL